MLYSLASSPSKPMMRHETPYGRLPLLWVNFCLVCAMKPAVEAARVAAGRARVSHHGTMRSVAAATGRVEITERRRVVKSLLPEAPVSPSPPSPYV